MGLEATLGDVVTAFGVDVTVLVNPVVAGTVKTSDLIETFLL